MPRGPTGKTGARCATKREAPGRLITGASMVLQTMESSIQATTSSTAERMYLLFQVHGTRRVCLMSAQHRLSNASRPRAVSPAGFRNLPGLEFLSV
jgi:hypothetical protein